MKKAIVLAALVLLAVLTLGSCATTRTNKIHSREIRAWLNTHADIVDLNRSEIKFVGYHYETFSGSAPYLTVSLYVRPEHNSHETMIAIRDDFIVFYYNSRRTGRMRLPRLTLNFMLEEDGEMKTMYSVYRSVVSGYYPFDEWFEWWHDESSDGIFILTGYRIRGIPFMRRNIHTEELDIFWISIPVK